MVKATQEQQRVVTRELEILATPELVERVARLLARDKVGPAIMLLMLVQGHQSLRLVKTTRESLPPRA